MTKQKQHSCTLCDFTTDSAAYFGCHLRDKHGIRGGLSGKTRRTKSEMVLATRPTKPQVRKAPSQNGNAPQPTYRVTNYKVLVDQQGEMGILIPLKGRFDG